MPLKGSARMVIMSTLMSVTVFMNFSKSRSDISRAVGVSAEAGAGDGAVAGASSTCSGLCCSFYRYGYL